MENNIVLVLAVSLSLSVATGLKWISSSTLPSGGTVYSCVGVDVDLPWQYEAGGGENVYDTEWLYDRQGGDSNIMANSIHDQFFVAETAVQEVQHLSGASIRLLEVNTSDTGTYNVSVVVNSHGSLQSFSQSVNLVVKKPPVIVDGRLQARMLPPVYNTGTQQWDFLLACGVFSSLGEPPLDVNNVVWTTPTDQSVPSTEYNNGSFLLHLSSLALTGNYTCRLQNISKPTCFPDNSTITVSPLLKVNGVEEQLRLLSGRLQTLENENMDLQTQLDQERRLTAILSDRLNNLTHLFNNLGQFSLDTAYQPDNCQDVRQYDTTSDVHTLHLGNTSFDVFCDQSTDGGGWTVIQRRVDGSVNFNRSWVSYENGFGNVSGEYWLGLANIYLLMSSGQYSLRVDLEDFSGSTAYAIYDIFSISGADDYYRLHVSGYTGTAGDSLARNGLGTANNQQFSTTDNDHSMDNCPSRYHSGWWFKRCMFANLNGVYQTTAGARNGEGIRWFHWHNDDIPLKRSEMKIRPRG